MGAGQLWTGLEAALGHQGTCICRAVKNQIQPVLTWSDVSWLGLLQQGRRDCAQTVRWLWHSFCTTQKGIDLGPQ